MNLKDFKEKLMFARYKDKRFKNAEACKLEIIKNDKSIDVNKLYIDIVNYQVHTYGQSLHGKKY